MSWKQFRKERKLRRNPLGTPPTRRCETCEVAVPSSGWDIHCQGKKHMRNLKPAAERDAKHVKHCDLCDAQIPALDIQAHLSGKRHQANLKKREQRIAAGLPPDEPKIEGAPKKKYRNKGVKKKKSKRR